MFTIYIALDTFVIKRVYKKVDKLDNDTKSIERSDVTSSDDYYKDDNPLSKNLINKNLA